MAFTFGQLSQYGDSVSIADPTIMVTAQSIQMAPTKGAFFQSMKPPMMPLKTKDFEIYNRTKQSRTGTITEPIVAVDAVSAFLDTTSIKGITVGSIIKIGDEYMWVSAIVSRSTGEVTVVRGVGGTTPATHLDNAPYTYKFSAINDTDLKNV